MISRSCLIFVVGLRALLSGRRWLLIVALDAVFITLLVILGLSGIGGRESTLVNVYVTLVVKLLLPFVALLSASEALGAEIEDRTIVYLTLRPLPAPVIVLPKYAAALLVTLLAVGVALLVGFLLLGGRDLSLLVSMLVSGCAGALAYTSVFLLLGLVQRRALLIGAIYILLWEGAVALLSTGAAHLSVQFYALGAFTAVLSKPELLPAGVSSPSGVAAAVVLTLITLSGVGLCSVRLRRIELR